MGSKKCTHNNVDCSLCLWVQKKCTRDISEVAAVFMDTKNVIAMVLGYSLRSWVKKNVPEMSLVTLCVRGFKKMYPRTGLNGCV